MSTQMSNTAFATVAGVAALLFSADAFLFNGIRKLGMEAERLDQDVAAQVSEVRRLAALANDEHYDHLDALASEMDRAKTVSIAEAGAAALEAQRYAERLARRVALRRKKRIEWARSELSNLRAVTIATTEVAHRLDGQVETARTDTRTVRERCASASNEISGAGPEIRRLTLAATVHQRQLAALRELGRREVFEFSLRKHEEPQEIAGLSLSLHKADPKRNRYSIDVLSGGFKMEEKDRSALEPVWVELGRRPCEIVVREIGKDEIAGTVSCTVAPEMAYSSGRTDTSSLPVR